MEPQKFGRYEIKAEIGRGGMATVYHAYDPRFEREVALKVLPREMLHDPQFRTRFEREAKTIAMLEHPAIVPVYDFGEEDGQPYFVMRFMTGGSLTERMKQGAMTIQEVAHLFKRLAPALDEAHAKGIIHRDLKPGNILFDQYGEPYISDFGIAKIAATQTNVTGSAIVGTPAYMSPEQAQGEGIDGRSDIYGLGVILFELLSGQQPYHGDTPMSVVIKHITEPVPNILDIKPGLPPSTETIIAKAMAKDRDQRFPTVKTLAEALEAVAQGDTPDLENSNRTLIASSKTVIAKRPIPEPGPISTKGGQGSVSGPGTATPLKKPGLWIGLGAAVLFLCMALVAGVFLFKDKIPFLAAPAQTATQNLRFTEPFEVLPSKSTVTPSASVMTTASESPASPLTPTPTPSITLSPTPTVPTLAQIGGADLIAFLNDNDIWVMAVDGGNLTMITKDGAGKNDLQWSPDGQSLFFISGKCVQSVTVPAGEVKQITCFNAAEYLDAFEISADGKQVAISLDRVVYVVPFDLAAISNARTWPQLRDMNGCFTYNQDKSQAAAKGVRWSNDGTKIAINTLSVNSGRLEDLIRIFDISSCTSSSIPMARDNFPADRFSMNGFNTRPVIPSFAWDGNQLFLLNSVFRYELGFLYEYNMGIMRGKSLAPLQPCCYTEARFSPDGSFVLFAYLNINSENAKTQLYYIPYGNIGTGATFAPLILPDSFFSAANAHLDATLRPVKP
jgi:serine/threonine protein kinase